MGSQSQGPWSHSHSPSRVLGRGRVWALPHLEPQGTSPQWNQSRAEPVYSRNWSTAGTGLQREPVHSGNQSTAEPVHGGNWSMTEPVTPPPHRADLDKDRKSQGASKSSFRFRAAVRRALWFRALMTGPRQRGPTAWVGLQELCLRPAPTCVAGPLGPGPQGGGGFSLVREVRGGK